MTYKKRLTTEQKNEYIETHNNEVKDFLEEKSHRLLGLLEEFSEKNRDRPIWEAPVLRQRFMNPISGTYYNLENSILLYFLNVDKGYEEPLYLTAKQGYDNKLSNKGEKSSFIVHRFGMKFGPLMEKDQQDNMIAKRDDEGNLVYGYKRAAKMTPVFNLAQFTGEYNDKIKKVLSQFQKETIPTPESVQVIMDVVLESMPTALERHNFSKNYYSPKEDTIHMAESHLFTNAVRELSTLLHEISHSYGHESRLNRDTLKNYSTDIKIRATEELIANLSAQAVIQYFDMDLSAYKDNLYEDFMNNHDSYDIGWGLQVFKTQPEKIMMAVNEADRTASRMIYEIEQKLLLKYGDEKALEEAPLSDLIKLRLRSLQTEDETPEDEQSQENKQTKQKTTKKTWKRK
jgi:antirestriction protein ArdC